MASIGHNGLKATKSGQQLGPVFNSMSPERSGSNFKCVIFEFWCLQCVCWHDDVIKWKYFPRYWPFVWEFTGHWWIPRTKASDAELWYFLWSVPKPKSEQRMKTPVIWDAIYSLWRHCNEIDLKWMPQHLIDDKSTLVEVRPLQCRKLQQFAIPETWKLAQSCTQMHLLCLPDPWNLAGTALLSGFQSSWGALKSTE